MALEDPEHVAAIASRYGQQPRPAGILWNKVIATQLAHRSVRHYSDRSLPDKLIETLVAAAQSAPTSSNLNLWSVVAVTDRVTKAQFAVLAQNQRHIDDAPLLLLWVADLARTHALGEREGQPTEALDYLETFVTATIDATLAAQNAATAAESLGLGTVYIGALRNQPTEVAALAGLPQRAVVLFGLVVGWPDPARPASIKPRPAQPAVLHRNRYSSMDHAAAIEDYDAQSRIFQVSQGLRASGWKAATLARIANAAALGGRDALADQLRLRDVPLR